MDLYDCVGLGLVIVCLAGYLGVLKARRVRRLKRMRLGLIRSRSYAVELQNWILLFFFILPSNSVFVLIGAFLNSKDELSSKSFDETSAASHLAWKISVVKRVDMAVACLTDLARASKSLERAVTDIDSFWRQRKVAEENKSAWELMETNFLAFLSHASKFFKGMEALPLLDRSSRDTSASNCRMLSVGKYWFWLL